MKQRNVGTPLSLAQYLPRVQVDGQSWQPDASVLLPEHAVAACRAGMQPASSGLQVDAASELLKPGYLELETGWARLENGQLYVAALTQMPNVTGEMIDWWFAWHTTDDAYLLWHPRDHVSARWKLAVHPSASCREQYIGNTSEIIEFIGSNLEHLNVWFQPPGKYFDVSEFEAAGIETAVCARGGQRLQNVWTAHLIHLIRKTSFGVEMRSRFWLGDVDASPKGMAGQILTPIMNLPWVRRRNVPDALGRDLMLHCAEEMHHLAGILPELYSRFGPRAKA